MSAQSERAVRLRELHRGVEPLVLVNAWDAVSARIVESLGFPAVATSSAGIANVLGYADGQAIARDAMLEMVARIARVVSVPVTADLERGYGDGVEDAAATARAAVAAGVVGLNIEDGEHEGGRMLALELQAQRIEAIRRVATETGVPLVINARTDAYWSPHGTPASRLTDTLARAEAYVAAGADCIFVPGAASADEIGALVRGIAAPINVLATPKTPPVFELRQLGVKRISLGSSAMGYTLRAFRDLACEVRDGGDFARLAERIPYAELNALF